MMLQNRRLNARWTLCQLETATKVTLFDHFVGAGEQRRRDGNAERVRHLDERPRQPSHQRALAGSSFSRVAVSRLIYDVMHLASLSPPCQSQQSKQRRER